jgi:hypothetical protein
MVQHRGGGGTMEYYNNSVLDALEAVYPEYDWNPSLYQRVAETYWTFEKKRRHFDRLAESRNIITQLDWYSVSVKNLDDSYRKMLKEYKYSIMKGLEHVYPEYTWYFWMFDNCPRGYWKKKENRRKYLMWLAEELQIEDYTQWYSVRKSELLKRGGRGMLLYTSDSFIISIQKTFPEFKWQTWRFEMCPKKYWSTRENLRECLEWFGTKLGLKSLDDWYSINFKMFIQIGGHKLLRWGTLNQLLHICYPERKWDKKGLDGHWTLSKEQAVLFRAIEESLMPYFPSIKRKTLYNTTDGVVVLDI